MQVKISLQRYLTKVCFFFYCFGFLVSQSIQAVFLMTLIAQHQSCCLAGSSLVCQVMPKVSPQSHPKTCFCHSSFTTLKRGVWGKNMYIYTYGTVQLCDPKLTTMRLMPNAQAWKHGTG